MSALWGRARVGRWRRRERRVHQGYDATVATVTDSAGVEQVIVSYLVDGQAHSFCFGQNEAREHAQNILGAVRYCTKTNQLRRRDAAPVEHGPHRLNRAQRRKAGRA